MMDGGGVSGCYGGWSGWVVVMWWRGWVVDVVEGWVVVMWWRGWML